MRLYYPIIAGGGLLQAKLLSNQSVIGSSCAVLNRQLYITGGAAPDSQPYNNIITINLTKPFSVTDFQLQGSQNVDIMSLGSQAPVANYGALFGPEANGTRLWTFGGGANRNPENIRYFDLTTGNWNTNVTSYDAEMPTSRSAFAWAERNGKFYSCGGNVTTTGELSAEFWQFDMDGRGWKAMPTLSTAPAIQHHQAALVQNRFFVVMGGQIPGGKIRDLSEVWVFDFETNIWTPVATYGGAGIPIVKFTPVCKLHIFCLFSLFLILFRIQLEMILL